VVQTSAFTSTSSSMYPLPEHLIGTSRGELACGVHARHPS
jgi:hypothetical protein